MASKRSRASYEADGPASQSPYVLYGTPLPLLESDGRDDGSYVPIWKQTATDERGRKRFHGAFSGGFSAGYFNTVGSKEGWTPSTFVSSRENRQQGQSQAQQRPEDFMDEEDLANAVESQHIQAKSSYAGLGSAAENDGRGDPFMGLMKATEDTMGTKLLQKMGWRLGQGIGPKVRRKACLDDVTGSKTNEEGPSHLFAPENSRMISFTRKVDRKGLGYEGETRLIGFDSASGTASAVHLEDEEPRGLLRKSSESKIAATKKRGGFGVGILNDTGSDEEDPYDMGPKISYNRVLGPDKKAKKKAAGKAALSSANPLLQDKPVFLSKKSLSQKTEHGFRKCHDGRLPLEGFVLSVSTTTTSGKHFPIPKIPAGWVSSKEPSAPSANDDQYISTSDAAKTSTLDPKARASILGEAQLPGKSVFDYISQSARSRIATATGRNDLPTALGEAPPKEFTKSSSDIQKDLWNMVPQLPKEVAAGALSRGLGGWMPYAEDEAKRARYRAFLELRAGLRDSIPERASAMSIADWTKELEEFAHAAQVFKPMTGMMASRFTTASQGQSTLEGQQQGSEHQLLHEPSQVTDPAEEAAKLGMYGPMTRTMQSFYPTRLLCKRFNVKPPSHVQLDPGNDPLGEDTSQRANQPPQVVSKFAIEEMLKEASLNHGNMANKGTDAKDSGYPVFLPQAAVVDVEKNDALEAERAGEAVFRAIFGSDDEDE